MDFDKAIIQTGNLHIGDANFRPCRHHPLCKQFVRLLEDALIVDWLDAKTKHTGSIKTHIAYHDTIVSFKETLGDSNLAFDSDPLRISVIAQGWAAQRSPSSPREGEVSRSTYNQRLAIVSSLYLYARKNRGYLGNNPIEFIDRPIVQAYTNADAFEHGEVKQLLDKIDRLTLTGMRDHALLSIGFTTGRRVSEICGMQWSHLAIKGQKVRVHFPRVKGGEVANKDLEISTSKSLMEYLHSVHGQDLGRLAGDTPIWISFSHNDSRGAALSIRALENICKKWCGSSKFHLTRHTYAYNLDQVGATTAEIQDELGHKDISTTGRYLKHAKGHKNKYGRKLEILYGLADEESEE